jgi:Na+-transporting methylmalonyl-CoA/oxaloacetate decarboxylase gamma subunit
MISVFIILILLIILLIIFVSRVTELVIAKIQQKNMQPALQKNLEQESVNPIHNLLL